MIERYHNKLIPNLGLCVKVQRIYELPSGVSETNKIVICGEGSVKVQIELDLLVFSPQPGEVVIGTIKSQTSVCIVVEVANVNINVPA